MGHGAYIYIYIYVYICYILRRWGGGGHMVGKNVTMWGGGGAHGRKQIGTMWGEHGAWGIYIYICYIFIHCILHTVTLLYIYYILYTYTVYYILYIYIIYYIYVILIFLLESWLSLTPMPNLLLIRLFHSSSRCLTAYVSQAPSNCHFSRHWSACRTNLYVAHGS